MVKKREGWVREEEKEKGKGSRFMCVPDGLGSCCGSGGNGINECI
jgi:hypothetical protein